MDKIKKLAERLGYMCAIENGQVICDEPLDGSDFIFDPLTNNDQFVEVLEWLTEQIGKVEVAWFGDGYEVGTEQHGDYLSGSFREAVLNTALAIGGE